MGTHLWSLKSNLQSCFTKNMLFKSGRVLNWALARRTYMSKARELHLKRQGMDRDNFLHDQKQGRGIMITSAIIIAFYGVYGGYWRHCQFEENKFVRLPINERERDPIWAVICQRQKMNFNGLLSRNPFLVFWYPLQETRKVTNEYKGMSKV